MKKTAVIGGGCFWCLEAIFAQLRGVQEVVSGYAGGHTLNPSYDQVHQKNTGHAEVIQVHYDPKEISYKELLEIFFAVHDPTTLNRQGNDIGPQYRSIILYNSLSQKNTALKVKNSFARKHWDAPIQTEIKQLDIFYSAEDYHQNYFERNPEQAYCQIVINPKLQKFRLHFAEKIKN